VAAARLAVAFVAAGTIAGAAWAQAEPPSIKGEFVDSSNVVDGSLMFKDLHKGEVPSLEQFQKLRLTTKRFKKVAGRRFAGAGELGKVKGEVDSITGELGTYLKGDVADARYLRQSDSVVRGDGSVFSESTLITAMGKRVPVMEVPGLLAVEAENGKPQLLYVTNRSGVPLFHTSGGEGGGGSPGTPAGLVQPGKFFIGVVGSFPASFQLFGEGDDPVIVTLTASAVLVPQTNEERHYTVQILVGT